jgi:uncharacterized protein (DUF1330 family)
VLKASGYQIEIPSDPSMEGSKTLWVTAKLNITHLLEESACVKMKEASKIQAFSCEIALFISSRGKEFIFFSVNVTVYQGISSTSIPVIRVANGNKITTELVRSKNNTVLRTENLYKQGEQVHVHLSTLDAHQIASVRAVRIISGDDVHTLAGELIWRAHKNVILTFTLPDDVKEADVLIELQCNGRDSLVYSMHALVQIQVEKKLSMVLVCSLAACIISLCCGFIYFIRRHRKSRFWQGVAEAFTSQPPKRNGSQELKMKEEIEIWSRS